MEAHFFLVAINIVLYRDIGGITTILGMYLPSLILYSVFKNSILLQKLTMANSFNE